MIKHIYQVTALIATLIPLIITEALITTDILGLGVIMSIALTTMTILHVINKHEKIFKKEYSKRYLVLDKNHEKTYYNYEWYRDRRKSREQTSRGTGRSHDQLQDHYGSESLLTSILSYLRTHT